MGSESSTFLPYLMVLGVTIITFALIYFWRNCTLFSEQNQLSSVASCALLWGGVGLIVSVINMAFTGAFTHLIMAFKVGFFESIKTGMLGIDDAIFLLETPIFAFFGAIFGACFLMLSAFHKASGSALQRGFIGVLIGTITPLLLAALIIFVLIIRDNISLQQIINQQYGVFLLIIGAVVLGGTMLTCLILGLITPRHLLK